ncbi:MAG: hypothetical protein IJA67_04185 [Oscillospiraceae bacterium]|nr:hypothetical protein [Oscillospiraceae bacterium]
MATRKELLEQYEDAQFALLMDEIMELQGEELRERSRQLKNDPAAAVPPEVRQRSIETIRTAYEERERGRKRHRIKTMVRTLLIAAVAATLLLGSVSADFRMAAKNFIYELTELAAELMFVFEDDSAETHDGEIIMGYFIPALPDAFELIGSGDNVNSAWRKYKSDDGFVMINIAWDDGNGFTYSTDAEHSETRNERINQFDVLVIESETRVQLILSDAAEQKHIEITSNVLSYDYLKKYVSGIKNN